MSMSVIDITINIIMCSVLYVCYLFILGTLLSYPHIKDHSFENLILLTPEHPGMTTIWKSQTKCTLFGEVYLHAYVPDENSFGFLSQHPPCPDIIKIIRCSTKLSMFFLPINVKMSKIVVILVFISRKNSILGFSEPEKCLSS